MSESTTPTTATGTASTTAARPAGVNITALGSSIYAPLSPSPGGLSSRLGSMALGVLGPQKPAGLGLGMGMIRSTSDNSAEQKAAQEAAGRSSASSQRGEYRERDRGDRDRGDRSSRTGGDRRLGGTSTPGAPSSRNPRASAFERERNERVGAATGDRDYRFREAAAANAQPPTAAATDAANDDGGWSQVGGGRREKKSDAAPSRSNDRFTRDAPSSSDATRDRDSRGERGDRDRERRAPRSDADRERGQGRWERDNRRDTERGGDRDRRDAGERRSYQRRGDREHHDGESKWHGSGGDRTADDEEGPVDETWDQPAPGCFTKAELLALWSDSPMYVEKPAHLQDLDGLHVTSLAPLPPVNIAPPTEEEAAARASGNWYGKSYPLKHRAGGTATGAGARGTNNTQQASWKGKQSARGDDDEAHERSGEAHERGDDEAGPRSGIDTVGGKKVIRSLQALEPQKQWRAEEPSTNAPTEEETHQQPQSTPIGQSSPPKRAIQTLGALPQEQQRAPVDAWRQEQQPPMDQQRYDFQHQPQQQPQHPYVPQQPHVDPYQQHHAAPEPVPSHPRWHYIDPQNQMQGPFHDEEMRDWYEKGFFDWKLLVACDVDPTRPDAHAAFKPLGAWFASGRKAFLAHLPIMPGMPPHLHPQHHMQPHAHPQPHQQHLYQHEQPPQQPTQPQQPQQRLHPEEDLQPAPWQQQPQPQQQPQQFRQPAPGSQFGAGGLWQQQPQAPGPQQPAAQPGGWPNAGGYHALGGLAFAPPVVQPDPRQQLIQLQQRLAQQQQQQQMGGLAPQPQAQAVQPPSQQSQPQPTPDAHEQQRLLQQRMAMLQQQQHAAIERAREQQLRESREALMREQQQAQPQAVTSPNGAPATLAPWSKAPATAAPAPSLFAIQQQAAAEEAARAAQRAADEEAANAAAEQARMLQTKVSSKEQAMAAKAAAAEEQEQAREDALASAQAAKEAKDAAARERKAAAAAAAAKSAAVTAPKTPVASFQQIQEEEARQAALLAQQQQAEAAASWSAAAAPAQANPLVAWNTPAPAAAPIKPAAAAKKPATKAAEPMPANLTREQKLALTKERKAKEEAERREAEAAEAAARKEAEEREKRERLERAKTMQKATWGVAPPVATTDLRAIQAADAARAAAEEQRRAELAAANPQLTSASIMAKWTAGNKPSVLSFREIQEREEAQKLDVTQTAASLVGGAAFATGATPAWGTTPSKTASRPVVTTDAVGGADEEEGIWGSAPAPQPAGQTVASKLAATFASQPKPSPTNAGATKPKPAASPSSATSAPAPAAAAPPATPAKAAKPSENPFGGPQMSLEFENWCRAQLEKLSGSSDVTLAHFLLTLESRSQIEEHIREVLGESRETTAFAAGFLKHRDAAVSKTAHQVNTFQSPLPASAAAAAAAADAKRKKMQKKK